jgi:hypothetical protein
VRYIGLGSPGGGPAGAALRDRAVAGIGAAPYSIAAPNPLQRVKVMKITQSGAAGVEGIASLPQAAIFPCPLAVPILTI